MRIKSTPPWQLKESDVTPESVYHQRRDILKKLGITLATLPLATQA
ncbi:MAG: mononuclear molybdenum enzyme YedY, partial [Photobacterium halotolerans]